MKLFHFFIFSICFFSCISAKRNLANKGEYFEKSGTLLSVQNDLYFVDTLFKSEKELTESLDSGKIVLDKLVFVYDTCMELLYRSRIGMHQFSKKFAECGLIDSLHEVRYVNVKLVLKNLKDDDITDAGKKINELCIYSMVNPDTAHYWRFRNNVKHILVNVLSLK